MGVRSECECSGVTCVCVCVCCVNDECVDTVCVYLCGV